MFTKGVKESSCVEVKPIGHFDELKPSKEIVCFVTFFICHSHVWFSLWLVGSACCAVMVNQNKNKVYSRNISVWLLYLVFISNIMSNTITLLSLKLDYARVLYDYSGLNVYTQEMCGVKHTRSLSL